MRPRAVLALVFLATILLAGSMTMLSVTAPVIGGDLRASPAATSWMVLGYLLVTATTTVAMGQLGDLWDPRRLFLLGMVLFAATSLALAVVGGAWTFVAIRTLQGLGGAVLVATAATLLARTYPGARLAGAMGIYLGGYAAAQVAAPPLAGVVTEVVGWRWLFVGTGSLAVAGAVLGPRVLRPVPRVARTAGARFDVAGNLVLVAAVSALVLGTDAARRSGWTDPWVVACVALAVVAVPVFVAVESRVASPVVDVGLLRERSFVLAVLAGGLVAVPRVVPTVVLAIYLQGRLGMSPTGVAGVVALLAVGVLVGSFSAGRVSMEAGVDRTCRASVVVTVIGVVGTTAALLLTDVTAPAGRVLLLVSLALTGLAAGIYTAANGAQIMGSAPSSQSGSVNGIRTTAQSVAIAVGTAALLTSVGGGMSPQDTRAFFSGDPAGLSAAGVDQLDVNIAVTLGALLAASVLAAVLTLLSPRRGR